MHVRSDSFAPYDFLPGRLAFAAPARNGHVSLSGNRNPHLAWSDVPDGTRSFAILCYDPEVPSRGEDVNQEGRTVPVDLPRVDFFHWVVADLPADLREIPEASHSEEVTVGGKAEGPTPHGGVQGKNNYTEWFAGDSDMQGDYCGYDGMGPPWNDERIHAYRFVVYALDVETLELPPGFGGPELREAIEGHVLGRGEVIGLYSLNPDVRRRFVETAAERVR